MSSVSFYILLFSILYIVVSSNATDLNLGTTINGELAYVEHVKLPSIPLKTRTKNVFYSNDTNTKVIKGIAAVDLAKGESTASVTAGGVGFTFVNIRLKSERGEGLDYQVQIFV
ncbi:uncharacterized protein ACR2FA_009692 [Aphomia sociella]